VNEQELEMLEAHWRRQADAHARTRRIAWGMLLFLGVGTVAEYVLAVTIAKNLPIMVAINVAEAAAIIYFFMHITRAWRGAGEEHH
jgi:cobalamin biosynthesis protein CobD/CbiB